MIPHVLFVMPSFSKGSFWGHSPPSGVSIMPPFPEKLRRQIAVMLQPPWIGHLIGETLSWDFLRTQLTFAHKRCWRTPWPLLLLWEFLSPYPFLLPCPAQVHIWMVLGGTVTIRVNVFLARFPLSYPTVTPKKKIHMACICVRLGPAERRGFNYYSYYWCLFSLLYMGVGWRWNQECIFSSY